MTATAQAGLATDSDSASAHTDPVRAESVLHPRDDFPLQPCQVHHDGRREQCDHANGHQHGEPRQQRFREKLSGELQQYGFERDKQLIQH